jgi:hypothetical protein
MYLDIIFLEISLVIITLVFFLKKPILKNKFLVLPLLYAVYLIVAFFAGVMVVDFLWFKILIIALIFLYMRQVWMAYHSLEKYRLVLMIFALLMLFEVDMNFGIIELHQRKVRFQEYMHHHPELTKTKETPSHKK